jgi:hypothetical protein
VDKFGHDDVRKMCPALALRLTAPLRGREAEAALAAPESAWDDLWDEDLSVTESWIAEIGGSH